MLSSRWRKTARRALTPEAPLMQMVKTKLDASPPHHPRLCKGLLCPSGGGERESGPLWSPRLGAGEGVCVLCRGCL